MIPEGNPKVQVHLFLQLLVLAHCAVHVVRVKGKMGGMMELKRGEMEGEMGGKTPLASS